ncbi:MAG: OsmC family protein [Chloroflexi bacterium]|nr:OsmC family protein [Chloroflexota bacterium]
MRGFRVLVDAPKYLGGADTGMHPVELLLCALGSFQCNIVKTFAEAQGIELRDLWVELEGNLDQAGLLQSSVDGGADPQEINLTFHLRTHAPDEAIASLTAFVQRRWSQGEALFNGMKIAASAVVIDPPARQFS